MPVRRGSKKLFASKIVRRRMSGAWRDFLVGIHRTAGVIFLQSANYQAVGKLTSSKSKRARCIAVSPKGITYRHALSEDAWKPPRELLGYISDTMQMFVDRLSPAEYRELLDAHLRARMIPDLVWEAPKQFKVCVELRGVIYYFFRMEGGGICSRGKGHGHIVKMRPPEPHTSEHYDVARVWAERYSDWFPRDIREKKSPPSQAQVSLPFAPVLTRSPHPA